MEGVLNAHVKRIIFSGSSLPTINQNPVVFDNIIIEEQTKICEADLKFNKWLEEVQKKLAKLRSKKIQEIEKKKHKDSDKIEGLEETLEEKREWNLILEIVNVQSHYHGALKTIEVTYRITEYLIDN